MKPPDINERLLTVLQERWSRDGLVIECSAESVEMLRHTATLRQTRVPAHLEHLASTRLEVVAAAPQAVRLALELRRELVQQLGPSILTTTLRRDQARTVLIEALEVRPLINAVLASLGEGSR